MILSAVGNNVFVSGYDLPGEIWHLKVTSEAGGLCEQRLLNPFIVVT